MDIIDIPAENELEEALVDAREGKLTQQELIHLLIGSRLYLPSTTKDTEHGLNLIPLIFDLDGLPMASLFTSVGRMNYYSSYIESVYFITFKEVVLKRAEEYGLVINPGYSIGLEIQAYGLKNIRKNFLGL